MGVGTVYFVGMWRCYVVHMASSVLWKLCENTHVVMGASVLW